MNKKIKTCGIIGLFISIALFLLLIVLTWVHEKNDVISIRNSVRKYAEIEQYEKTKIDNEQMPQGITYEYKWNLGEIASTGEAVCFYEIHQYVDIYVEDELIYSLRPNENNWYGKTTGCAWAVAHLVKEDENKEIRVCVSPIYSQNMEQPVTFYQGSAEVITGTLIHRSFFMLLVAIATIVIGIAFILFVLINFRNLDVDRDLLVLGCFSIFSGLWKLTDMPIATFLINKPLVLSNISLVCLSLMVPSFVLYIRNHFMRKDYMVWNYTILTGEVIAVLVMILHMFGIWDLRESLILSHAMILAMIFVGTVMLILETKKGQLSKRLKITIFCLIACMLGAVIDMIIFYISKDTGAMMVCLLAFLAYAVIMGYLSVKDTKILMEKGKEADHYEQMAMHDDLSGLYNRTFYSEYLRRHNLKNEENFVVVFDVNELKTCNDTLGHEAGDKLIRDCAKIIRNTFETEGKCMRIGGDEFVVILRHYGIRDCEALLSKFEKNVARFNEENKDTDLYYPIQVAYGCAWFDQSSDVDFSDTIRRADKMMYLMKMEMKREKE